MKKILYFMFLILLFSCSPNIESSKYVDISSGWEYSEGAMDDSFDKAVAYNYKPLQDTSDLKEYISGSRGVLWLRKEIEIPDNLANQDLGILLGIGIFAEQIFLNGNNLGSMGVFPNQKNEFTFSFWNYYSFYKIPSVMFSKERNVLYRRIFINYEGTIQGQLLLGEADDVLDVKEFQDFYRSDINLYIAIVLFIIALYHFLIYLKRMSDPENLYYSILCISFAVYMSNFFIQNFNFIEDGIFSYLLFQKIIFTAAFMSTYFLLRFINSFLFRKVLKVTQYVLAIFIFSAATITILTPQYSSFLSISKNLLGIVSFVGVLYTIVVIALEMVRKNKNAFILMLGMSPFIVCILFDIVFHTILEAENLIFLTGFGFPAVLVTILFILANRFVDYRNQAENLNVTLEEKVQQRTKKLEEANEEIQAAYEELEAINDNLTETNRELEDAKMIMDRDMDMAINVQSSLFPKYAPDNDNWEVGFYFKPMAGVSGDGYDFYIDNGVLKGISLFDVSGHGIASALVTMMAKTILFRSFADNEEFSLNDVLEKSNEELIEELKDVDNYLTGIMLRMYDSGKVEYVNAGHPDMILKKGTGEIVVPGEDTDYKGFYLGVEAMRAPYNSIDILLEAGDSLLLYSDCITETSNSEKVEFGFERLKKVFAEIDSSMKCADQVGCISKELFKYAGTENLDDDLSIILIKKI